MGDIGWAHLYHLGDEAMTEAAIAMLRERNVTDVVLVADDPSVAEARYGVPAVPRFGFEDGWGRPRLNHHLAVITTELEEHVVSRGRPPSVIDAVAEADAVLIAGGGNLNSQHKYRLYERAALARIARHFSKPLFVTSQTVGPLMREPDIPLLMEIVDYATCFGAREATTLRFLLERGADATRVVHTMDDAMMLTPDEKDFETVDALPLGDRFVVASFIAPYVTQGPPAISPRIKLAHTLDVISESFDVDIAISPHEGSFDAGSRQRDQLTGDTLVQESHCGRLVHTDMLTARQVIALTQRAVLSVSTRYHPLVFAPFVSTPAASLSTTHYSSVRMRGALANVGLERYAMPGDTWGEGPWLPVLEDLLSRRDEFDSHMQEVSPTRTAEQSLWWDAMVSTMAGDPWPGHPGLSSVPSFDPSSQWLDVLDTSARVSDRLGMVTTQKAWAEKDHHDAAHAHEAARAELARERDRATRLEAEYRRAQNRRSAKIANRLSRVFTAPRAWARKWRSGR